MCLLISEPCLEIHPILVNSLAQYLCVSVQFSLLEMKEPGYHLAPLKTHCYQLVSKKGG